MDDRTSQFGNIRFTYKYTTAGNIPTQVPYMSLRLTSLGRRTYIAGLGDSVSLTSRYTTYDGVFGLLGSYSSLSYRPLYNIQSTLIRQLYKRGIQPVRLSWNLPHLQSTL